MEIPAGHEAVVPGEVATIYRAADQLWSSEPVDVGELAEQA